MEPRAQRTNPVGPLLAAVYAVCVVCVACTSGSSASTTAPEPSSTVVSTSGAPACTGSAPVASRNIAYRQVGGVDPNLLSLDVDAPAHPPGCGRAPMVVFVHGGGFRNGDKANDITDKVTLFTGRGWVFASVNYRLSPSPPNDRTGQVRYPVHEQDVAAGIAWLQRHAADYGGDPTRIMLVGHSSGAFLVSLLSTDTSFLAAAGVDIADVRCTVALDTEYDVAEEVAQGGAFETLYRNAFGDDPATWTKGSPIEHTRPGGVRPSFLVVTQGRDVRTTQAQAFVTALNDGGTRASLVDVTPLDHQQVNAAVGAPGDTAVTPPLVDFLTACASQHT